MQYFLQGMYSDGKISEEYTYNYEENAKNDLYELLNSPYFEGDSVRIITSDGELIAESKNKAIKIDVEGTSLYASLEQAEKDCGLGAK